MKIFFTAALASLLFSCSKNNDIIESAEPEISFDLSGIHYSYTGELNNGNGTTAYVITNSGINQFYGTSAFVNNASVFNIFFKTDSLHAIPYFILNGNGTNIIANNRTYTVNQAGDELNVIISSYDGSVLNGTFTGKLSTLIGGVYQQELITNGQLKNLNVKR